MVRSLVAIFRQISAILSPELQRRFWTVMALTVVTALTEFALAGAVSLLGVVLASPQTIVQSSITQQLLTWMPVLQPATEDPRLLLALLLCLLCCTVLLKTLLLVLLTWQQSQYSQAVSMNLGVRLFQSYMRAPYLWHRGQKVSELMTVLGWRANAGLFLFNGLKTISQFIVVITLLTMVCCMAPLAGLLVVSITSFSAMVIFRYSRRWVHHFSRQCADAQQTSMKIIHTCLNGVRDVQIYQQEERFIRQYIVSETRYMQGRSILP
ncbi:MAG: ABC transporter ATP-binding protein, partial [Desulfovibrio sp.]|nr:ABC transporter ATP-binding protein [Desulfovibrio sp.]